MWELETRILLNFLTFLLIIIQFVICISFSGFSCVWKVTPTSEFHRKTAWTKQWQHAMTQQPITPRTYQTAHQQRIPIPQQGTIQHHTKPCIQQHIQQHTEQSTYQTTYQITTNNIPYIIPYNKPNTKQQSTSGPIRRPTKRPFQPIKQYDKPNSLQSIQQSTTWGYEE